MRAAALILCASLSATAHAEVPETITREMIQKAITKVKPKVMKCAHGDQKGVVKLTVKVAPDGTSVVTIKSTFDEGVAVCVKRIVQKARYDATINGGSFSYPFAF